jgi:hypothetical protein
MWGSKKFGCIPRKIKQAQDELLHIQHQNNDGSYMETIREKEKQLDDLLKSEEVWWRQRSRALWLKYGDKNTSYFHQKANQRRRKNKIENLTDDQGIQQFEPGKIEEILLNHFSNLFDSQETSHIFETVEVVRNTITPDLFNHLEADFTGEEVTEAINSMKGLAAPGPDGLPAIFYHTYWDIIRHDVIKAALQVLNEKGDPTLFNQTHICLIPKKNNPNHPSDFRPISLCNVIQKIITKTIANRIKHILPEVISQNQSAFVPGRLITDNTLVAFEIFHFFKQSKNKQGYISVKIDMAKAYDRVEWPFLQVTLETMGFPQNLTDTIMKCVKTVNFSILINGRPSQSFCPKRGLRQGDPLSPYLFIICANVFSNLITKAQQEKQIHGVKIAHGAPEVSHLLFADDSLLFCRANDQEAAKIKSIIIEYQEVSGQLVNMNKSEIMFSKHVPLNNKEGIGQILPMQQVTHFSKYLGMPTHVGRSKKQTFNYLQDCVWKKIKGWKARHLSFAGRSTLIKAVAQAIPTYVMTCFLIPKELCNHIESMICKIWWGSNSKKRKIHWVKWSSLCKNKKNEGLGFREMRAFNEALLAKQG